MVVNLCKVQVRQSRIINCIRRSQRYDTRTYLHHIMHVHRDKIRSLCAGEVRVVYGVAWLLLMVLKQAVSKILEDHRKMQDRILSDSFTNNITPSTILSSPEQLKHITSKCSSLFLFLLPL
jgi:hypothetical protein